MQITSRFQPKSIADWSRWLDKYSEIETEIWVVIYKKKSGKQTITYDNLLDEALCYGWIDNIEKGISQEKYAIRFTPRKEKSNWTDTNIAKAKSLITQNRMKEKGFLAFNKYVSKLD